MVQDAIGLDLSRRPFLNPIKRRREMERLSLELWLKTGSLPKTIDELYALGYRSRRGTKIVQSSIRLYAHDYITRHPLEARKLYQEYGEFLDTEEGDKDWVWYIINVAVRHRGLIGKNNFIRWAVQNNLYKPGFKLFQKTFNLKDEDFYAFD